MNLNTFWNQALTWQSAVKNPEMRCVPSPKNFGLCVVSWVTKDTFFTLTSCSSWVLFKKKVSGNSLDCLALLKRTKNEQQNKRATQRVLHEIVEEMAIALIQSNCSHFGKCWETQDASPFCELGEERMAFHMVSSWFQWRRIIELLGSANV